MAPSPVRGKAEMERKEAVNTGWPVLHAHPDLPQLRGRGHTDGRGRRELNDFASLLWSLSRGKQFTLELISPRLSERLPSFAEVEIAI